MLWTIAHKELLENLRSFRFTACFVLCVVLITVSSVVGARDYRNRLRFVVAEEEREAETLSRTRVYSHIKPVVYRRPSALSVFSQGYERTLGPGVQISHRQIPFLSQRKKSDNPYLEIIPPIDISTVVKVIMSLLAILLSFDAVSGEKEAGTLKLILSNAVSRPTLLFGKYIGSIITLTGSLVAGFLIGVVVLVVLSPVGISGARWWRILFLVVASGIYLSVFLLMGLFVSAVTRKAATSLIVLLSIWLFLVIIAPNLCAFIAAEVVNPPSELDRELEVAQIKRQVEERVDRFTEQLGPSEPMGELTVYGNDGEVLVRLGRPERYEWLNEFYKYRVAQWMETADLVWERDREYLSGLKKQAAVSDALSMLSPAFLYERICQVLSDTDFESHENLIEQTREYRAQLIDYISAKDGFTSRRWFTDDPPGQEPFVLDPETFDRSRMDMDRGWRMISEAEADESRILNLGDMPEFRSIPRSAAESIERSTIDLSLLIGMNLLLFIMYFKVFMMYDAR
jgi:ABC-type transport system involved in multi-copper enzyme maturation permease subunit